MKLKTITMAAVLAFAPVAANAFSVDAASTVLDGGSYDIAAGPYFWGATFTGADNAGSVTFNFSNSGSTGQNVGVAQGTVLQFSGQFDGVTASWGNGQSQTVAPGQNAILNISSIIGQGATDYLTVAWGNVTGVKANIDLDVAAVPVPAGAALLGSALLGFGAFAHRKKPV